MGPFGCGLVPLLQTRPKFDRTVHGPETLGIDPAVDLGFLD